MSSFVDTLKQLGPARLGMMAAIVLGLLVFFVYVSLRVSTPDMKLLYADLTVTDSGAVTAKLEELQIPYEVSSDGSRVVVPGSEVGRARMLLAEEGLPNGGSMGYEIFDKQSSFGTTNFVQNINQTRALEGELARTISSLDNIRSARVHIVLPKRELFSRENREASASVFLGVHSSIVLGRQQIASIQSLVASSVATLKPSNVSVIDSNGNLLAQGAGEDVDMTSMEGEERRKNYETSLVRKIEDQVSRIVGQGKVTAIVTADMNFDRISTNEELYDPEGQVLRSSQVTEESSSEREAADEEVSVGNNLPGVNPDLLLGDQPSAESNRLQEVTNYEISKTIRSVVRQDYKVNKLSVSVLVDGRYETNEDGEETYVPRSDEELEQIGALVRSAVGIDEERGDTIQVSNLQFADIDTAEEFVDERYLFGFEKSDLIDAAELIVVSIMMILVALLVLQPMIKKLLATSGSSPATPSGPPTTADMLTASPSNPALAAPTGNVGVGVEAGQQAAAASGDDPETLIDIQGVEGKVKASTIKKVEEIVDNYPAETVSVIRNWMTQE